MPTYTDIGGAVASLRVLDEFSAPIAAAIAQMAELEATLRRFRTASVGLSGPFTRLSAALARAQAPLSALTDKLAAIDAPIAEAAETLAVVRTRTAEIAASAADAAKAYATISRVRAPALLAPRPMNGGGERVRGAGRRAAAAAAGGAEEDAAAGAGAFLLGGPAGVAALAGGYAVFESFKQAMTENLALVQSLAMFNVAGQTAAQKRRDIAALRTIVRQSAMGTIFTESETARAMLGAAQMAGFSGQKGLEQFASIFPIVLRLAEVGQMQGLGSISENIKAAIGFAHLTRRYSAAELVPGLDEVLAIAERTHSTITQTLTTMKYGIPMALASGANVDQAAQVLGFLMRAGLGRSAGYSLGQMILGVLNTGGALNAHLATMRAGIEKALGPNAETFKHLKAHAQALHALGILDAAGKLTVLNKQGGVDLGKLVADIQRFAATHEKADLAAVLHAAFGTRGMRGAVLLGEQAKLLATFEKLVSGTPGAAAQQAMFARTPLQQFEQLGARLRDVGNELATDLLPALNKLLIVLVDVFDAIDNFLADPSGVIAHMRSSIAHMPHGHPVVPTPLAGPPLVVHPLASGLAAAINRRALHGPIGTHGDPVFTHPIGAPAPGPVTVNQDFRVTVNGITDPTGIMALMNQWWGTHRADVASATRQAVEQQQQHNQRRTFIDHGLAGAAP